MTLLDVRDPERTTVADHWETMEQKWVVADATAAGERVYVAAEGTGVLVVDPPLGPSDAAQGTGRVPDRAQQEGQLGAPRMGDA